MVQPLLAALLAAAVTVAEGGIFFQPALSPDGKQVAFAADEQGVVSIYVAPADGSGPRVKVTALGRGVTAQRLAMHALMHAPWSPDGKSLLFLAQSPNQKSEQLNLWTPAAERPGEGDAKLVGPVGGLVENASFTSGGDLVFTYRDDRFSPECSIYTLNLASGAAASQVMKFTDTATALDLAPSPDGRYLAVLCLYSASGDRDERRREVRVIDLKKAGTTTRVDYTDHANFLTWSDDSKRLYFIDQKTGGAHAIPAGVNALEPPFAKGLASVVDVSGALIGMDREGLVVSIQPEAGTVKPLAFGFAPVSAEGGKIAFVRLGREGAAIVVTDGTREAVESGDLGLPKPPPPPAPAPEKPADAPAPPADAPQHPADAPPANGGEKSGPG